jgi:hypothetical protein
MKFAVILMAFFIMGALFIISNNNLALAQPGNFEKFIGMYGSWLENIYENAFSLTGNAVKMQWLP